MIAGLRWRMHQARARFDAQVLRAPAAPGLSDIHFESLTAAQKSQWQALQAWARLDAGSGQVPLWRPWQLAMVPQPLAVAVMVCDDMASSAAWVEAFCRDIDGTGRLVALPHARARLAWRLRIKLSELAWWRGGALHRPWDAGFLRSGATVLGALQSFRPRRPSFIVMLATDGPTLQGSLGPLHKAAQAWHQPVRLLVLVLASSPWQDPAAPVLHLRDGLATRPEDRLRS